MCNNEKFVDTFAQFLYQAMVTAKPAIPQVEVELIEANEEMAFAKIEELEDQFADYDQCEICDKLGEDYDDQDEFAELLEEQKEEQALEDDHLLACQEAASEDASIFGDGLAMSDDGGWFYDDE